MPEIRYGRSRVPVACGAMDLRDVDLRTDVTYSAARPASRSTRDWP